MKVEIKKMISVALVIALLAASRLVKHPFNFTPVAAMSIFAGCYLRKHWGVILPLGAMLASDSLLGFYDWKLMAAVYLGMAISFYIGWQLKNKISWQRVGLAAISSSFFFFFISNFAVWLFYAWYPHSFSGLLQCFVAALPFFRNSLLGDLIYTSAIFGAYEFVTRYFGQRLSYKQSL